jgi:hypothetical protein
MEPGVNNAKIPNNTTVETNCNGFNMVASSVADAGLRHLGAKSYLAGIICHSDGIRLSGFDRYGSNGAVWLVWGRFYAVNAVPWP